MLDSVTPIVECQVVYLSVVVFELECRPSFVNDRVQRVVYYIEAVPELLSVRFDHIKWFDHKYGHFLMNTV